MPQCLSLKYQSHDVTIKSHGNPMKWPLNHILVVCFGTCFIFPFSWEWQHHPNWLWVHHFFRGVGQLNHQPGNQHQKDIKCHDIPWNPMKKTHGRSLGPGRVRGQGMLRNSELHWGASWSAGDQIFCGDWIMDIVQKNIQYIYIHKYYDMIWYDTIWYDMIWYIMIWYDMIWYNMIWYDMIQYDMIWYDMIQYDMIWYYCLYIHIIQVCLFENALYIIYIYVRAGQTVCRLILYAESQMRHFYPIVTTHN